ncbi:MAG: pyruvate formate-lyase [Oscillospiraceae bacterium]|nr:pyruvate formate-lyase [Oscillospiraceae bacterium]
MHRELYTFITEKKHRLWRKPYSGPDAAAWKEEGLSPRERMADRFARLCSQEEPHILPGQKIAFIRTVKDLPNVLTEGEWADIRAKYHIHELGYLSNLCPDYATVMGTGLLKAKESADPCTAKEIDALLALTERYREAALEAGLDDMAEVLARVPAYGARTFREALQALRILHWAVWAEGEYHNTLGRFDLYMKPYFERDIESGILTKEEAYELICDFFLDCNIDSDLYPGIQQGDNGQSMMLGGIDVNGDPVYSELSVLCLRASGEIRLIDPKINLRVSKNTPLEIFIEGSRLTAAGLGFPQYSNDDIVIPGLEKLGYAHEDAVNYSVAACWEFIIPGVGADIANIGALSFPKVIDRAFRDIAACPDMDAFWAKVEAVMREELDEMTSSIGDVWFVPAPFMDLLADSDDISKGGKYNNFGFHGTGTACAADALAAVEKYLYDEKIRTAEEYLAAVESDFKGDAEHPADTELLNLLRNRAPKMGQNTGAAEKWAKKLLHTFASLLEGRVNSRGGCFRAGTGTAMYYLWHSDELGASPDGRRQGEPLGTNYSASLFAKLDGPVSVIDSFTAPDLTETVNGGPLTLEFQQKMFEAPDGVEKVAHLVRYFIRKGGHQLQLNAVSRDTLLDAQEHPEKYPHLIVRVWGWSAYFVELDRCYQDQVLRRQEYVL